MDKKQIVLNLWTDIDRQNWDKLSAYFLEDAAVYWRNTNEKFSPKEFVLANSQYPGDWVIEVEKLLEAEDTVISVVKVTLKNGGRLFMRPHFFS